MWESNVIRDGISSTYEERGGAKSRIKDSKELLMGPGCSLVLLKPDEFRRAGNSPKVAATYKSAENTNLAARMASRRLSLGKSAEEGSSRTYEVLSSSV